MLKIRYFFIAPILIFANMAFGQEQVNISAQEGRGDKEICAYMVDLAEKAKRIPEGLLQAIALVESGRKQGQAAKTAWPWTVTTPRGGKFFETRAQALKEVEGLRVDGKTNIDIGCMQVNLFYHGRGFGSLQEALSPVNNVAYATEFLVSLYRRYDNWGDAVKHYHSSDPQKNNYYLQKVIAAWRQAGDAQESPYFDELKAAVGSDTAPPLPPTEKDEQVIAKRTAEFAQDLVARINVIDNAKDREGSKGVIGEELQVWEEWQQGFDEGLIKGKSPDYYINLFDDSF